MGENTNYLKMATPTDILVAHYFTTSGQLPGKFVQEVESPYNVWWQCGSDEGFFSRIKTMLLGDNRFPNIWEFGSPACEVKKISWLDLFRKSIIRKIELKAFSKEIIVLTTDRELFFNIVKQHFLLNQGELYYTIYKPSISYFIIKIKNPSLWVFEMISNDKQWIAFNKIERHGGLYVENGFCIDAISEDNIFNKFQMLNNGILLIHSNGQSTPVKTEWKNANELIKIDCPDVKNLGKAETQKIFLKPKLVKTNEERLHKLWKIDDQNKFSAILNNEGIERFKGYSLWHMEAGDIWITSLKNTADRGLAGILSDAFDAFIEVDTRIFVPAQTKLSPSLSIERLSEIFGFNYSSWICFATKDEQFEVNIFPRNKLKEIDAYIAVKAEQAICKAELLKSNWFFDFTEERTEKLVVDIVIEDKQSRARPVLANNYTAVSTKPNDEINKYKHDKKLKTVSKIKSYDEIVISKIIEIDKQLMQNVSQAKLWKDRGSYTQSLGMLKASQVSRLTATILEDDTETFIAQANEYLKDNIGLYALFRGKLNEIEKGKLLAKIRKGSHEAELHYVSLLFFSFKFNDFDMFEEAISLMKSAFTSDKRDYFSFSKITSKSSKKQMGKSKLQLLNDDNLQQIKGNVKNFLRNVRKNCYNEGLRLVCSQLDLLLSFHLSNDTYNYISRKYGITVNLPEQNGFNTYSKQARDIQSYLMQKLKKWDPLKAARSEKGEVKRWLELIVMDRIKEASLEDFFMGDLYKPPFEFKRYDSKGKKCDLLKIRWIRWLSNMDFPDVSDGKALSRAIYKRYSAGKSDWSEYFEMAMLDFQSLQGSGAYVVKNCLERDERIAKAQRLLLLMVAEYGPLPEFEKYIMPTYIPCTSECENWQLYRLIMHCDMFRLHLAYEKPIDEQTFFSLLIKNIPFSPSATKTRLRMVRYEHFSSRGSNRELSESEILGFIEDDFDSFRFSTEWVILSLFLTSSNARRYQLEKILEIAASWLAYSFQFDNIEHVAEILNIFTFLEIGILTDLVPETLKFHHLNERRKAIWIQHAFKLSINKKETWKKWQKAFNAHDSFMM